MNNKNYDVRLIRFVKAHIGESGDTVSPSVSDHNDPNVAICLSHFDYLFFEELNNQEAHVTPLQLIGNDRKSRTQEDNYTYPLYILKKCDSATNAFWEIASDYTSVIRVHHNCDGGNNMLQSQSLTEALCEKLSEWYVREKENVFEIPTPTNDGSLNVEARFQIYDSLELGDSVIILKCNSMAATLLFSKSLLKLSCVLDSYTYLGISPKVFKQRLWGTNDRDKFMLESASTRFKIHSLSKAQTYFGNVINSRQGQIDLVTGTTDAKIRWKTKTESDFLQQISQFDPEEPKLYEAFDDTITRVGTLWSDTKLIDEKAPKTSEGFRQLYDTHQYAKDLSACKWLKNDGHLWLSLNKLFSSVKTMGKNCVMDDLANLLIPSMFALAKRISQLAELEEKYRSTAIGEINELIRDYFYLIYDISRLEGQLVQHPELYPAPYYLPATILQFEMQFAFLCAVLFSDISDVKNNSEDRQADSSSGSYDTLFYPVLIPFYTKVASTFAPLDPASYTTKNSSSKLVCPLRIYLPVCLLYDPFTAVQQLCHEVAHYSGNSTRCRTVRLELISECCASMIMSYWEEILNYDFPLDWDNSLVDSFLSNLKKTISNKHMSNGQTAYLSSIRKSLPSICTDIFLNSGYFDSFHNVMLSAHDENSGEINKSPELSLALVQDIVSHSKGFSKLAISCAKHIEPHINYICDLMKEGYADIAMIQLLEGKMDVDTYLRLVLPTYDDSVTAEVAPSTDCCAKSMEEYLLDLACDPILKGQIDRYAFVLNCMDWKLSCLQSDHTIQRIQTQLGILERMRSSCSTAQTGLDKADRWNVERLGTTVMSVKECKCIVMYLSKCKEVLCAHFYKKSRSQVEALQKALLAVSSDGFNWVDVQQFGLNMKNGLFPEIL